MPSDNGEHATVENPYGLPAVTGLVMAMGAAMGLIVGWFVVAFCLAWCALFMMLAFRWKLRRAP